ncbi:MAG TPA: ABC transporter ATP-binding protein [Acidimicrobiales bacterium]|nr:ABC transporter ATP-binding protein [Acidimicrobiales bacterium]
MRAGAELIARSLSVGYRTGRSLNQVLLDVDIELKPNRIVGVAGESGCGKSTLALSLAGYRSPGASVLGGSVELDGASLPLASLRQLRRLWGARIAYLAQDSTSALNPALRIGRHFDEALAKHLGLGSAEAMARAGDWLGRVEIPDPAAALGRYPHQFSGGQQQRIALALALACEPAVLLLDEPTTGLDVVTQAQVNRLLSSLVREMGVATLYVSHNLALLAAVCDELAIMYAGQVVERAAARDVYFAPRHPYTRALLAAVPTLEASSPPRGLPGLPPSSVLREQCGFENRCVLRLDECMAPVELRDLGDGRSVRCVRAGEVVALPSPQRRAAAVIGSRPEGAGAAILTVRGVSCEFRQGQRRVLAVDQVSIEVSPGKVLGIAGESGSGKSTLLRIIAGLVRPTTGEVLFAGRRLETSASARPAAVRRSIQIVFQNPDATLNPRHTVLQSLERPLALFRPEVRRRDRRSVVEAMIARVRLPREVLDRRPGSLSGGQRQRVAIARALLAEPVLILCDEVTSALDVSVQATVLELLSELRDERGLALVFVTHDLGVLRAIADEAIVMQTGVVRERGRTDLLLSRPEHPYTRQLLAAVPDPRQPDQQAVTSSLATR